MVKNNRHCTIAGNIATLPDATNLAHIRDGRLYKYNGAVEAYRCPADRQNPPGISTKGQPRVRSYSLEGRMGGDAADSGWVLGPLYPMRTTMASIGTPGLSEALVFIEEGYISIDDGYFAVKAPEDVTEWLGSPSIRHGNACAMSFADGHAEMWRWLQLKEQKVGEPTKLNGTDTTMDLQKLQRAVATMGRP